MFDLWEVRECFHRHYRRPPRFIVAEAAEGICGLLPASWIEESRCYGYFPGETWEGKTWLEQNRVLARDESVLAALLSPCRPSWHLRYLLPLNGGGLDCDVVDETGYLFLPPEYDYDIENYFRQFSHKSAKRLKRELDAIQARGVRYRLDDPSDFDILVRMNLERFGDRSYFSDGRFLESFRSLMNFLKDRGWLRLTTLIIDDGPVAVDIGCVYRGVYTVLGGGTHGGYPGVAKFINIHHMQRACRERLQQVDFLCGDFSWKKLFHLKPRPLYLLASKAAGLDAPGVFGLGGPTRVTQARARHRDNERLHIPH
ncbi:MAG: GNAT family N-acetyltransferase [Planctomycetes bacterium]|nr:GNAT family N-acetyltransferase [Planctomycetota bacterium]